MELNSLESALKTVFTASRSVSPGAIRTFAPASSSFNRRIVSSRSVFPARSFHTAPSDETRTQGRRPLPWPRSGNRRFEWISDVLVFNRILNGAPDQPTSAARRMVSNIFRFIAETVLEVMETGKSVAPANRARKSAARVASAL